MKKVYIVVECYSIENCSLDPNILGVFEKFEDAKQFFDKEIDTWRGCLSENYEDDILEVNYVDGTRFIYECTDFDTDELRIMKLTWNYVL